MGIMLFFFQYYWNILGDSIIPIIQENFETGSILMEWAITNIVLVSKIAHPESVTQFISLCNTLYKLVSRIIVQRLKPYLAEIINPYQAGFVPGRRTSDNIILVEEIIHFLRKEKGLVGYLALKLDLDKAYDSIEWNLIQDTLNYFHIPQTLKNLILNMITSTRFSILWHGSALPTFPPCHGIRQGDPLSPYLFILCLERLSILLNEATQRKLIQPMTF